MSKKILYCASTASHILNFHLPYLQYFKEQGWQVDVAIAGKAEILYADRVIELPLKKNLIALGNLRSVQLVRRLLSENHYDLISTHTTLAGAMIRLALQLMPKQSRKVVYTSHGYFFNGTSTLRERLYLWTEKALAPVTDLLMVMNRVDYELAIKHKLGKQIVIIPGMGLYLNKFGKVTDKEKRSRKISAGYKPDDFLIVYAAEMSKRKNQGELIRAFAIAIAQEPSLKLLLAGDGVLKVKYQKMVRKYDLEECIYFLGHVQDIASLYQMCDLAVSTSRSEGLPFNVMEAMASGLPVVASRIKGHIDLLGAIREDCLYDLEDERGLANSIRTFCLDKTRREQIGQENLKNTHRYKLEVVMPELIEIYNAKE